MERSTNPFVETLDRAVERVVAYRVPIITGISVVIAGICLFAGYQQYQRIANERAHKDFTLALSLFESAESASGQGLEKWNSVAKAFEEGYQKNKGTGLAAAFLAYQADVMLKTEKLDDAVSLLKKAINVVSAKEIKAYYELKLALVQLDSSREELEKEGLTLLQRLASGQSSVHEQALYQLGLFYWIKQNFDEAKNYWQQFMIKYGNQSGFADLSDKIKEKLELLAV